MVTDTPYMRITLNADGATASIEGVANCDDAILFCRGICRAMYDDIKCPDTQRRLLSEMIVSVLLACCNHQQGLDVMKDALSLYVANHGMLGR